MNKNIYVSPKTKFVNIYRKQINEYISNNYKVLKNTSQTPHDLIKGINVFSFLPNKRMFSKNKPVILRFLPNGFDKDEKFVINIYSIDKQYNKKIITNKRVLHLYNLIPLIKYFWFVTDINGKNKSNIGSFIITSTYRLFYFPKFNNVRDIGGKETIDGRRIKYGLVFRGPELTTRKYSSTNPSDIHCQLIHKCDIPFLFDVNFKVQIDLRTDREAANKNECMLNSKGFEVEYHRLPGEAYQWFFKRAFETEEYRKQIRETFKLISNANKKPVYINCWGGADRTGTICFVLEALLGVKVCDLVIDYELTSFVQNYCHFLPFDEHLESPVKKTWSMREVVEWLNDYSFKDETIQDAITRFLVDECKVDYQTINKIKQTFTEENKNVG